MSKKAKGKRAPKSLEEVTASIDGVIDKLLSGEMTPEAAETYRKLADVRMRHVMEPRKRAQERRKEVELAMKWAEMRGELGDDPLAVPRLAGHCEDD